MKTWFKLSALAALLAVGTFGFAQDGAKKDDKGCCQDCQDCSKGGAKVCQAIHEALCPQKGKCEGACKEVCGRICDTVKLTGITCMEKCKKAGMKCEGCEKAGKDAPCEACSALCVKTLVPWLKEQMGKKDATHTTKGADGKEITSKCTLLTGPACAGCADEMSDAMIKACKDSSGKKQ